MNMAFPETSKISDSKLASPPEVRNSIIKRVLGYDPIDSIIKFAHRLLSEIMIIFGRTPYRTGVISKKELWTTRYTLNNILISPTMTQNSQSTSGSGTMPRLREPYGWYDKDEI